MDARTFGRGAVHAAITLLGITLVIFLLFTVLPGNPARLMAGRHATDAQVDIIRAEMGLDQPVAVRLLRFINDLSPVALATIPTMAKNWDIIWDAQIADATLAVKWPYFGRSYVNGMRVGTLIWEAFPETLILAISAVFLALLTGIPLGINAARKPNGFADKWVRFVAPAGLAVPSFVLAMLIGWIFGHLLSGLTGLKMTGSLFTYDVYQAREVLLPQNLVLPALTLAFRPMCVIAQLMRGSMTSALASDYVRTARAKGLTERMVVYKHALINALSPTVTMAFTWLVSLLAGSVFVEYIFGWNGLGQVVVKAIEYRDFPVITGLTLILSLCFLCVGRLLALAYPMLDPRLRAMA